MRTAAPAVLVSRLWSSGRGCLVTIWASLALPRVGERPASFWGVLSSETVVPNQTDKSAVFLQKDFSRVSGNRYEKPPPKKANQNYIYMYIYVYLCISL